MREQLQAMNQLFALQLAALQNQPIDSAATTTAAPPPVAAASASKPVKELAGYTPYKSLPKAPSGELTARQKEHVQALVERYTQRTEGSKRKTQEYRNVLADPRVVAGFRPEWKEMVYPIVTVRSEGLETMGRGRERIHRHPERFWADHARPPSRLFAASDREAASGGI